MSGDELKRDDELRAFSCHEADLIWSRYNAMVVADTIFIAVISAIACGPWFAFFGSCAGIVLTSLWWLLTSSGWALSHRMLHELSAGSISGGSAIAVYKKWCGEIWGTRFGDPIWCCAHMVIAFFYIVYSAMAIYHFAKALSVPWAIGAILPLASMGFYTMFRLSVGKFSICRQP